MSIGSSGIQERSSPLEIELISTAQIRTKYGSWRGMRFYCPEKDQAATVLKYGSVESFQPVLCRVHSSCHQAHDLLSTGCDCLTQMELAQKLIVNKGRGLIIFMHDEEGRGFGLEALMHVQKLAKRTGRGQSDFYWLLYGSTDGRDMLFSAAVLNYLRVAQINLITNHGPDGAKVARLTDNGIQVAATTKVSVDGFVGGAYYQDKMAAGQTFATEPTSIEATWWQRWIEECSSNPFSKPLGFHDPLGPIPKAGPVR